MRRVQRAQDVLELPGWGTAGVPDDVVRRHHTTGPKENKPSEGS
jgi:hypothetical protein